jgi:hypothetical protein
LVAGGGDPRIEYNVAQALTALERYPDALAAYQRFIAEAPPGTLSAAQQERFFALLDELKNKITRFEIHCAVEGARVLVRDTAVGVTPLRSPVSLNAGPAKVEAIADGFKPFTMDVVLEGGKTQVLEVNLERVDFTGALTVRSSIPATRVLIDRSERGVTPLTVRVERGTHLIASSVEGYDDQSKTVSFEPGSKRELTFFPVRSANYTTAWIGFVSGGVAIIGGGVTGALAFTSFNDAKGQCDNTTKQCGPTGQGDLQTSKTFGVLSDVLFGLGAAGAGVGILGLYLAARDRGNPRPVEIVVGAGALSLQGAF